MDTVMPARTRSRVTGQSLSGELNNRNLSNQADTIRPLSFSSSRSESCSDFTGNWNADNSFSLTRTEKSVSPITGPSRSQVGAFGRYVVNTPPPEAFQGNQYADNTHLSLPNVPTSALTDKLLARSSPSRPIVDLPVFLFELKDLPNMIRQAGRAIKRASGAGGPPPDAQGVASAHLAYNFGWAPLIDDLSKLLNWQEAVDRKMDQLRRLHSKGGLRRNITLEEVEAGPVVTPQTAVQSSGILIYSTKSKITKRKSWGSVRWNPSSIPKGGAPSYKDAFMAAFGLNVSIATVWEALPWSWLIDWFSSVGDYLAAHRNTVPATPSRICIMQMTTTVTSYPLESIASGFGWKGATVSRVTKTRTPTSISVLPTVYLPFLSGYQLSILGALAIVRAKPGR